MHSLKTSIVGMLGDHLFKRRKERSPWETHVRSSQRHKNRFRIVVFQQFWPKSSARVVRRAWTPVALASDKVWVYHERVGVVLFVEQV